MDKKELSNEKLEVRSSRNGLGGFAKVPIRQGAIVWDYSRYRTYTRDQVPVPYVKDAYLQVTETLYVGPDDPHDPDEASDLGDFINHSCDPNCAIRVAYRTTGDVSGWVIVLVALRAIEAGEEITYDYMATMHDDPWEIPCNCGSPKCRGAISERVKQKKENEHE